MNPFRWVRESLDFLRWFRAMTRKDEHGKSSGFLYKADDPAKRDYLEGITFGRRVFVSFAHESLPLAKKFEDALRSVGLEPWRYEPAEGEPRAQLPRKTADSYVSQLKCFRAEYPEASERIEATIRRSTAVLFLISEASLRSAICELEAWIASIIHGYGQPNQAAVYVVLERSDLSPPVFLSKFWSRVYEPGLEEGMAGVIASEIKAQEAKLRLIEELRARKFR